ncbi:toll/interleukin-1 receptor domain-containing protein [Saccharopolyspora spinosa]|uniref:TIR domain-containing protein n=1 Tax=Saccharopolyspora spinosa TaxID=60894 RepID=A0A2N3XXN4_SACSN|nr:toll/interleukin-1 receptor domain-containing protein [Saccharopolyspora spinosa]PKW15390.1 TIR domain-containing protein [Saccharopolyspora spinosa]
MPEIFINYRTGDCEHAAVAIEQNLSARFGRERVFRASKSIRPGDNYRTGLSTASSSARVLLVLIGPKWLDARDRDGNPALNNKDDWTRKEILNAMRSGARIIPILCGRKLPRLVAADLPRALAPLADLQSLTYDTGSAEAGLDRIAAELVDLVPGLVDRTAKAPSTGGVHYTNGGPVNGNITQLRDMSGGSITNTAFNGPTGPVSTDGGDQHISYGDGATHVTGNKIGGIRHKFGSKRERGEDR